MKCFKCGEPVKNDGFVLTIQLNFHNHTSGENCGVNRSHGICAKCKTELEPGLLPLCDTISAAIRDEEAE